MTRTVEGEVVQIIPPENHDGYMLKKWFREAIEGEYLVNVDTEPEKGFFGRLFQSIFRRQRLNRQILFKEEPGFEEGDFVILEVQPAEREILRTYEPVSDVTNKSKNDTNGDT